MDADLSNRPAAGTAFPPTQWGLLDEIRAAPGGTHRNTLDQIVRLYWKPVYSFVRRLGNDENNGEDITQGFFADCLRRGFFAKAERERGLFRTFLIHSLNHYIHNLHRAGKAQRRLPEGGLASLDELREADTGVFEPSTQATPEDAFNRAWALGLLRSVLQSLETECRATAKHAHYTIFLERIVRPNLEGSQPPSLNELGARFGLAEKQAANCLITARRAFQRLLREQLAPCASSESEVDAEIQFLFGVLQRPF